MLSSAPTVVRPSRQARLARAAVAAVFLTNGALYANVVPRFPQLKADLELSNVALGSAVAAMPFGALLAAPLTVAMIIVSQQSKSTRWVAALLTGVRDSERDDSG